jgi:hypothetical protein
MTFESREMINNCESWARVVRAVRDCGSNGHQWIFKALHAWSEAVDEQRREARIPSSFDKACKRSVPAREGELRRRYESWMLLEFKREAYHHLGEVPPREDFLEWLALGRHYGMPSRLVDFTYSFYVAAYFALAERSQGDDGCIVALDNDYLKNRAEEWILPRHFALRIPRKKASFHDPRLFHAFAFHSHPTQVIPVNPLRRNPRLARQHGLFLCPGDITKTFDCNLKETLGDEEGVRRVIRLPSGLRSEAMRDLLDMNISSATLFPGLAGWAESQRDLVHKNICGHDERFKQELDVAISRKPRI